MGKPTPTAAANINDVTTMLNSQLGGSTSPEIINFAKNVIDQMSGETNQQAVDIVLGALGKKNTTAAQGAVDQFLGTGSATAPAAGGTDINALLAALAGNKNYYHPGADYYNAQAQAATTGANASMLSAQIGALSQKSTEAYQKGLLQLQAGQQDLAERSFQEGNFWTGISNQLSAVGQGTNLYGAQTQDVNARGNLDLGAAGTFANLTATLGSLAEKQSRLGLDILTTPRNAVAGFLMGLGADPAQAGKFSQFNVKNLLGIDPGQIQGLVNAATSAAQSAQQRANQPSQINIKDLLDRLNAAANAAVAGPKLPAPGATVPGSGLGGVTPPTTNPTPEDTNQRPAPGTVTVTPGTNPILDGLFPSGVPSAPAGTADMYPNEGAILAQLNPFRTPTTPAAPTPPAAPITGSDAGGQQGFVDYYPGPGYGLPSGNGGNASGVLQDLFHSLGNFIGNW